MTPVAATPTPPPGAPAVLELLESRWTLRILLSLAGGGRRFSDLKRDVSPISGNVLSARIQALQNAGLIVRVVLPPPASIPVYRFSPLAEAAKPFLDALLHWDRRHAAPSDAPAPGDLIERTS